MIDKIFDLGDTTVREVMVPLVDVVGCRRDAALRDAIALIQQTRLLADSRLSPSARPTWSGVVAAHGPPEPRGAGPHGLTELMRPPNYVPETKRIDDLLREMQKGRNPAGGGGGRVRRRHRHRDARGHRRADRGRDPGRARAHAGHRRAPARRQLLGGAAARTSTSSTRRWTGACPSSDYETVAGLVLATLHRIPRTGEVVSASRVLRSRCSRPTTAASRGEDRAHGRAARGRRQRRPPAFRRSRHARQDGGLHSERQHDPGIPGDPAAGKGPGVLVIQEWWGLVRPHQERVRPLRGRGLLGARARHVPRPDRQRAGRRRQALHGAEHRAGREGPARRRGVPAGALVDAEARRGGLLHGRPARPLRRPRSTRAWAPA